MLLLDGKKVRDEIAETLRVTIEAFSSKPTLVIIQVGDNAESSAYIRQKKLFGEHIGAKVTHTVFPKEISEREVLAYIRECNENRLVHGIIVQIPIPAHLSQARIVDAIVPEKDVDGLCSRNVKLLFENSPGGFLPATAKGIMTLLSYYHIPVAGKEVVVVGRSTLVGKPVAQALLNANATVTIAHRQTANLPEVAKRGDILVVAAGKPHFIQKDHVRAGQVIIDVGITAVTGEKLEEELGEKTIAGDVHFSAVKDIVSAISPVPGGVGPMTVASLFENLVLAYQRQTT